MVLICHNCQVLSDGSFHWIKIMEKMSSTLVKDGMWSVSVFGILFKQTIKHCCKCIQCTYTLNIFLDDFDGCIKGKKCSKDNKIKFEYQSLNRALWLVNFKFVFKINQSNSWIVDWFSISSFITLCPAGKYRNLKILMFLQTFFWK